MSKETLFEERWHGPLLLDPGAQLCDPRHEKYAGENVDVADGATDARAALALADAESAPVVLAAGTTYRVATDLTLTGKIISLGGALRPDSGVTVTISGRFDAPLDHVLDYSSGGSFSFGANSVKEFRAEWFGLVADGTTDDTTPLRRTFEALATAGGGFVTLPAATILYQAFDSSTSTYVQIPSNTIFRGAGYGRTILKLRNDAAEGNGIRLTGVENIFIGGLGFDFNGLAVERSALTGRGARLRGITLKECHFFDSNPPTVPGTANDRWALSLTNETGTDPHEEIRVVDCICENYVQLLANAGIGYDGLWVERCSIDGAEQNAIAVPFTKSGGVLRNVWIRDNLIKNTHGIGIYLGPDQSSTLGGTMRNIVVRGNVFQGCLGASTGHFVHVRYPNLDASFPEYTADVGDITVDDNDFDGNQEDGTATAATVYAVRIFDDFSAGVRADSVAVVNNRIKNVRYGIWAQSVDFSRFEHNTFENCLPIFLRGASVGVDILFNQMFDGLEEAIYILDSGSADHPVRVFGNRARGFTQTNRAGLRVESTTNCVVRSAHNNFRGNFDGIRHVGAGTFDVEHAFDDVRDFSNAAITTVAATATAAGIWNCPGAVGGFKRTLVGTAAINTTVAAGATYQRTVTVTGASPTAYNRVTFGFSAAISGALIISATVTAANTVTISFYNPTGAGIGIVATALAWVDVVY